MIWLYLFHRRRLVSNVVIVFKYYSSIIIIIIITCFYKIFPYIETETALLKLYNDIILSSDSNMSTILLCLDFSSAFDTVDHSLLLNVLEISFGITGSCLSWFNSYLSNRSFYVSIESSRSSVTSLTYGVPHVFHPWSFTIYSLHFWTA